MRTAVFTLAGLLSLAFGFGVLVATFVWLARQLAGQPKDADSIPTASAEPARPASAEPEPSPPDLARRGAGFGALYGLVLGVLACSLFWISPLTMALGVAGLYYSGRAAWYGIRWNAGSVFKALAGLMLNAGSVVLHYLSAIGEMPTRPF